MLWKVKNWNNENLAAILDLVPWTKKLSINNFHFWLKLVYRHHVNQKCIKTFLPVFVMLNLVQPNSVRFYNLGSLPAGRHWQTGKNAKTRSKIRDKWLSLKREGMHDKNAGRSGPAATSATQERTSPYFLVQDSGRPHTGNPKRYISETAKKRPEIIETSTTPSCRGNRSI